MKLSVFTTVTDPKRRGDNFIDAWNCYSELADEVVRVDGSDKDIKIWDNHHTYYVKEGVEWPQEFSWPLIGQQFQRGYEACTGDWVIHADLDFIFHERDFATLRKALELNKDAPGLSFWKYQFILPDRYNLKSRLVLAVNKGKYGDRIRFDSGGDLCQPSLDGQQIQIDDVPEARVPFYNYEKLLKTKEQIMNDQGRMERAYFRHFKRYQLAENGTDESAYDGWLRMQQGRFNKPQEFIGWGEHPQYVRETIRKLKPEQWGYSGFGNLEVNMYAQSR
jgi:hypothetical protein